jgi:hypothetical protein
MVTDEVHKAEIAKQIVFGLTTPSDDEKKLKKIAIERLEKYLG